MNWRDVLPYAAVAVAAFMLVRLAVYGVWWAIGKYRIRRAGPRPLRGSRSRIWFDPGPVDSLDPVAGPGGADGVPRPPFHFIEEHLNGSQPCVSVRDRLGRVWRVKWGDEARCEAFAVRFAWSCGYFAEQTHFIASGTIEGCAGQLARAGECIDGEDGRFRDARFELDDPAVNKLFDEHSWAWDDNPFVGTRELSGLKIVVMLLSNWDTKDRRDVARGSNTAIFESGREAWYLLSDWGGSMGRWGANIATRAQWDPDGFVEQTPTFVLGVEDGEVRFGYTGQRTAEITQGISLEHVRWLYTYLVRLDQDYLMRAMLASGATSGHEASRFVEALLDRIHQLGALSSTETQSTRATVMSNACE